MKKIADWTENNWSEESVEVFDLLAMIVLNASLTELKYLLDSSLLSQNDEIKTIAKEVLEEFQLILEPN